MPVSIEFSTANAAFAEATTGEVARVLCELARTFRDMPRACGVGHSGTIRDSYGNTIGRWSATIDAEDEESSR
jgi:hypothetical protein